MKATQQRFSQCAQRNKQWQALRLLRSCQQPIQDVGRKDGGKRCGECGHQWRVVVRAHAATCCCLRDAGSATSLPAVMTCNWHWRRYGTSLPQTYVASLEMPNASANSWRPPKCLIAV